MSLVVQNPEDENKNKLGNQHETGWNGFDAKDIEAFKKNIEPSKRHEIQKRLDHHYWQCMDELCDKYNYVKVVKHAFDWSFSPINSNMIGNLGVGYWKLSRLAIKWCVGYHAWEIDQLTKTDMLAAGLKASTVLASEIKRNNLRGIEVEYKAVQRFNYVNVSDQADVNGSSCDMKQTASLEETSNTLHETWKTEMSWLDEYMNRRGTLLKSEDALKLKKDIAHRRDPLKKTDYIEMAVQNSEWKLFPALDVFLWISTKEFFSDEYNQLIQKEEQLSKLDLTINILSTFAQTISNVNASPKTNSNRQ
jgi:hypothetical protein